jgi:hypothetical protein
VDRADENDLAGCDRNLGTHAALEKLAHRSPRAEKCPAQIHVHDGVPLRSCHLVKGRISLQPGIVDKNIHGSEFVDGLGEHCFDFGFISNIRSNNPSLPSAFTDFFSNPLSLIWGGNEIDDHVGSGSTEREGDRAADSGIGTRHKSSLSLQ